MKKFFFTILLSISLCFGKSALGIDASTLNDLSPTNTIYTSQQVDQIANDISHEITLDYALKTNVLSGVSDEDEAVWTCTQSDNIYEFPLHVRNSKFTINPGYIGLLGIDGEIRFHSTGIFDGVHGFVPRLGEGYNLPSNAPGTYILATTNDIPDVSGYVPWANARKDAILIGRGSISPYSLAIGESVYATEYHSIAVGVNTTASGNPSFAEGNNTKAAGANSHSEGKNTRAAGISSHSSGQYAVTASAGDVTSGGNPHNYAFAWSGTGSNSDYYYSHGEGTFNIRPKPVSPSTDPASGFYIGESNLVQIVNALVDQRIAYAVENGITVNGTNYLLITENTLTNVFYNFHGHEF